MQSVDKWIIRVIVVLLAVALGAFLIRGNLQVDLGSFNFSDLLTLVIAFFAIWISLQLYHRGTDTANRFYNEMHQFTNHVSEILGRIEGSHGEALRIIGERVERIPIDVRETQEDIKKVKDDRDRLQADKENLIKQFQENKNYNEEQKGQFLRQLHDKDKQLAELTSELARMRQVVESATNQSRRMEYETSPMQSRMAARRIAKRLPSGFAQASRAKAREIVQHVIGLADETTKSYLLADGFIQSDGRVTDKGFDVINRYYSYLHSAANDQ